MPNNSQMRSSRSQNDLTEESDHKMYGAVDLGTNNCRLLIAQPNGGGFRVTNSYSRIVRLGEGLCENGYLSDSAMDRAINALKICSKKLETFNVKKLRNIATEACRRAKNCDEFFKQIKNETGLQMETVTSDEEAQLALRGCQNILNPYQPYAIVFDIGGGSTEIIWAKRVFEKFEIIDVLSLPFGVVTLAEKWMKSEINCQTYEEMVNHVAIKLPIFCERNDIKKYIENKLVQMLGTSGTVTTLGAVHLNLNRYDRSLIDGLKLSFQNIELTSKRLIEQDYKKRMKISCIGDDRAELIIPGCAILEAVCNRWAVGELYVADRGLREGMLLELMTEDGILAIGNPAATSLMKK